MEIVAFHIADPAPVMHSFAACSKTILNDSHLNELINIEILPRTQ